VTALAALGLRQQGIDLVDDRIAFNLEADGRVTKNGAEDQRQAQQDENGSKDDGHVKA